MRAFIAIPLPAEARSLLGEFQDKLRPARADVRWTAVTSIHLTLKFLGEINPAGLPRLTLLLRENTAPIPPLSLGIRGLGAFPDLRNPRVVWCGLEGQISRLTELQTAVERACTDAGFASEDRPFRPHLTLGRVRGSSNLRALADYIKIGSTLAHGFEVRDFHVYQSILRPQGAVYNILETIALTGDSQP